jgi:polyisoprenoid-binding protein YceI
MNKRVAFIMLAMLGVAVLAGGLWLYDWVLGDTLEASQPITPIPLPAGPETLPTSTVPTPEEVLAPDLETDTSGETAPEAIPATQEEQPDGRVSRLTISQEESQARFTIFEELNGQPTNVVGVTNQAAGEAEIHWNDLDQTRIGMITINARTLVTDQDRRNQAIRNRILHTDRFEYVTFTPKTISGLSGSASPGQTFTFQISGDLTIREISQAVVFEAIVMVESIERLSGIASTTIRRNDFDLLIPSVPFVANVGEDVGLEIEFILIPAS